MRIGLFALETGRKVGGLEVYETELIRALARVDEINEYEVFCLDPQVPEILGVQAPNFRFVVCRANRVRGILWDAPRAMAVAGLDLFHALFVPPPFTSVPYVFTYHGSEVLERPEFYPFMLGLRLRFFFRRALKRARLILCVSEYLREHLLGKGFPNERLRAVHHGCRPEFHRKQTEAATREILGTFSGRGLGAPYILSVGRIEPRKNPVRVLRAYAQFRRQISDAPSLVFAGEKNWGGPAFDRALSELGLGQHVHQLGHVPHEKLPALYGGAEFVVFASLWEGFGLPALEAMASGTPLITSRCTSLPEIAGDACVLVNPESVEEIAAAMVSLHGDGNLRTELTRRGRLRAGQFTWDRTARKTVAAYAEARCLSSRPGVPTSRQ